MSKELYPLVSYKHAYLITNLRLAVTADRVCNRCRGYSIQIRQFTINIALAYVLLFMVFCFRGHGWRLTHPRPAGFYSKNIIIILNLISIRFNHFTFIAANTFGGEA